MTHFLQRTSLIALAAGALGACSTLPAEPLRPNFPITTPDPAAAAGSPVAQAGPGSVAMVEEAPLAASSAAPVQSRPLAALAPAALPPAEPIAQPAAARERVTPTRRASAEPASRTVSTRSVTGKVVEVEGAAQTYKVRKGDTLEKIAKKLGATVAQLREDNDIGRREKIQPGQTLKGPASTAKAYVVGQGDTLFAIARRFGVSADDIAIENKIGRNSALRAGQRLRLPDGFKDKGPIVTTTRVTDAAVEADEPPPAPTRSTRTRAQPQPAAEDEADPGSPFAFETSTRRSVTGRVITVEGPARTYKVKKGDNLEKIADKLGTDVDQLREDNGLKKRGVIHPGQVLKGPRSEAKAYVAVSGDTLATIARRFGVTAEKLRAENGLSRNAAIRSGQRLRLPEGYRDRGPITETVRTPVTRPAAPAPRPQPAEPAPTRPPVATAPPVEPAPSLPSRPQPYSPSGQPAPRPYTPPPVQQPAPRPYTPPPASQPPSSSQVPAAPPSAAPTPADAQISELGRGRFVWPLQGQVVSDFGPKGGGQRNDGINIDAQMGAPVRAAAAGDVVYAGDQVPGFGNLVLIKHADGWVTAYAHLSHVDVKMQQRVAQGQQIGQAGASGGVPAPQLHFEVRFAPNPAERARPIDPKLVLPR